VDLANVGTVLNPEEIFFLAEEITCFSPEDVSFLGVVMVLLEAELRV
jgi:hypothetical protein